ncbi:MAG: MerR family transcriptional regulator [Clostridia bacterium]|nr:MerR family transcriptional regulator [Clostridia bacterium]
MNAELSNTAYMTVGEVAAKTGLTVRAIQYYDQQGLLTPSAKGSRNLRLYTDGDMERLYRIMTYKALGLSIKEIRFALEDEKQPAQIMDRLQEEIKAEERELLDKVKRYGAMKNLEGYMLHNEVGRWQDLSELINYLRVKWDMIWELNLDTEGERLRSQSKNAASRALLPYYTLLAETVRLMREGVPADSEETMDVMKQFTALASEEQEEALLFVDPEIMSLWPKDYAGLWQDIKSYMKAAEEHYTKREED